MHQSINWPASKPELYDLLARQTEALIQDCPPISAMSNIAALLWEALPDINWAGFYLLKEDLLYLGPFQGKTACTLIPVGRGVCGTAAATRQLQLVPDVHQFPGHIACDSASNSEIVIPLMADGQLVGVMDIDSPLLNRFDEDDAHGLQAVCRLLMTIPSWRNGLI